MDFLDVQKLADANRSASRLASSRVAELWESLDGLDEDMLRDVLDELFPRLVEEQAQLAASATLEWYEDARSAAGIKEAYSPEMPAELIDYSRTSKVVEEAVSAIAQRGRLAAVGILQRRAKQLVSSAARETGLHAARHDPAKPQYARVPAGATTCAWCLMWAGRGFVYKSEETAQFTRSHADCDCQIVPAWSNKPIIHGYDPSEFEAMYKAARDELIDQGFAALTDDVHSLTAAIRLLYGDKVSDGYKRPCISENGFYRLADGSELKFGPRDVRTTQAVIDHILQGTTKANGKRTGGHSYRQVKREMRPGQIAFPRTWSDTDIIRAAFLTITNPTSLRVTQQGRRIYAYSTVNGVQVATQISVKGKHATKGAIITTHPIRGVGVLRASNGKLTPVE